MSEAGAIEAYVAAVRGLLARGGFERTGDPREAKRFRLTHIAGYLEAAGHPERRRTVHVAGSKGKGSTAALVESVLRAAGARTLLLTSPDVHQARERVRVDGEPLGYAPFAALAERLLADGATRGWSYFELLTVLGWLAGAEAGCEWQVLEVGLGGRLDTTNVIERKEVAVIAPIDLEHTAILGDTIAEVAGEKAGILTGPCEAVIAPLRESALEVVRARAAEVGATLHEVAEECALRVTAQTLDGQTLDLRTPLRTYRGLRLPLLGRHQAENAAAAVRAAELAWASGGGAPGDGAGAELPAGAVATGLAGGGVAGALRGDPATAAGDRRRLAHAAGGAALPGDGGGAGAAAAAGAGGGAAGGARRGGDRTVAARDARRRRDGGGGRAGLGAGGPTRRRWRLRSARRARWSSARRTWRPRSGWRASWPASAGRCWWSDRCTRRLRRASSCWG